MSDRLVLLWDKLKTADEKTSFTPGEIDYMKACVYPDFKKYCRLEPNKCSKM